MSKPQAQNSTTALAVIPAGFGEIALPSVPEGSRVPYIQFVYTKSKNYAAIIQKIPTIREGEPVLLLPEPANPIKLAPFKFFLLSASEYWGQYNQQGELLASSSTKPDAPNAKPKWDQTIEAAVLVILDDRLVPASVRFKTTTCPAVTKSMFAASEVKTEAWGKKGPEYAFTLRCDQPRLRFTTHAVRVEKTNREKGTTYPSMEAAIHPTKGEEFTLLQAFWKDADAVQLLNDVASAYRKRVEAAKKKELVAV